MLFYNKHIHQAFLQLSLIALLTACSSQGTDLSGKWIDQKDNKNGLRLDKEGFAWYVNGDKKAGGTGLLREDGKEVQMKYTMDESKSPMWFDLIVTEKKTGKEESHLLGIINLIDKDNMEMMLNLDTRDQKFDKENERYSLMKRTK
jgi:hypothetical protein